MTYKWIAKTKIKHDELESVLKDVEKSAFQIVALPSAGYTGAGEPLITLVAKKRVHEKARKKTKTQAKPGSKTGRVDPGVAGFRPVA